MGLFLEFPQAWHRWELSSVSVHNGTRTLRSALLEKMSTALRASPVCQHVAPLWKHSS